MKIDEDAMIRDAVEFCGLGRAEKNEEQTSERTGGDVMGAQRLMRLEVAEGCTNLNRIFYEHNGKICLLTYPSRSIPHYKLQTWNGLELCINADILGDKVNLKPVGEESFCQICWSREKVRDRVKIGYPGVLACDECCCDLSPVSSFFRVATGKGEWDKWNQGNWFKYPPIAERRKKAACEDWDGNREEEAGLIDKKTVERLNRTYPYGSSWEDKSIPAE